MIPFMKIRIRPSHSPSQATRHRQTHLFAWAVGAAFLLTQSLPAPGEDWPQWQGPNRDGISKEAGWQTQWPANGPKVLWKATLGTGFGTMSVSEGRVYSMGNQNDTDTVFCLDAETGSVRWKHSYPCKLDPKNFEGGPCATPTVAGNVVYTCSRYGDVVALDANSGKVVWSKNLLKEAGANRTTWGLAGSVLILDNLAILNIGSTGCAVEKATGKIVWSSKGTGGYSTPVPFTVNEQKAVALFSAKSVLAVAVADGKKLWEFPWVTSYDVNAADPIISGDKVFISSGYGRGCALLKMDGASITKVWENKGMRNHYANCVLVDGYLYGFDGQANSGKLKCIELDTGADKWEQAGLSAGGLMVADGKLVALADRGKLVIAEANPSAFKKLAEATPLSGKCWTMAVLSNGRIYARNNKEGELVCLDVKSN
jgi:outer membrane protein assembly factor BamB